MKVIKGIFTSAKSNYDSTLKEQSDTFVEMLSDFNFSRHHNDVSITYYVAGFVSRGMTRNTKCKDCCNLFSDGQLPLEVEIADIDVNPDDLEAGKSFLYNINRGGLFKPSNLFYVTCITEYNNEIHKERKCEGTSEKKRDLTYILII